MTIFRAAVRRLRPTRRLSDDLGVCATGCGSPVALGEAHYTVIRQAERQHANGEIEPLDGDALAYVHVDCWPTGGRRMIIEATIDLPGASFVRPAVAS